METERAICCSFFLFVSPMQRRAVMPLMKPLQRGRCIIVVGLSRGYFTLLYHHLPRLMISIHDCPPQSRLSDHRSGFSSCRFCSWSRGSIKDRSTPIVCYVNEEHWTENAMRQYSKQSIGNCAWSPQNKLINGTVYEHWGLYRYRSDVDCGSADYGRSVRQCDPKLVRNVVWPHPVFVPRTDIILGLGIR